MSKYHDIKKKYTISVEEEKEYRKSSITRMIEESYNKKENLPDIVLKNINFLEGFYLDYYVDYYVKSNKQDSQFYKQHIHIVEKCTIAENIIENLPLKAYQEYMDITWLKILDNSKNLISKLLHREQNDVVLHFLELVSKENKKDDFNQEVFNPIFNINENIFNLFSLFKNNSTLTIKNYFEVFKKALEVYEPFYLEECKNFKIKPEDIKKWHKNFDKIYILNQGSKKNIHRINSFLLKSDEFIDLIKEVFNQYENPKDNTLLTKQYFTEAIKNGNEKIVTYYISELLKNKILTQEEIETQIVESLNEKLKEISNEISNSFKENYKYNFDYSYTYNIEKVYNIAIKYGNYKPNYKNLSILLLIDNKEFQENFVSKILNKENIVIYDLNVNQWKYLEQIIEQIKEISGKGFEKSVRQKEERYPKEMKDFIDNNPYEFLYIINIINKNFVEQSDVLNEKELDKVYDFFKKEVSNKMLDKTIDIDKLRLNNKLKENLEPKGKVKALKI